MRLRGGQGQRLGIAIARTILAGPKRLILDEATSNLNLQWTPKVPEYQKINGCRRLRTH